MIFSLTFNLEYGGRDTKCDILEKQKIIMILISNMSPLSRFNRRKKSNRFHATNNKCHLFTCKAVVTFMIT